MQNAIIVLVIEKIQQLPSFFSLNSFSSDMTIK